MKTLILKLYDTGLRWLWVGMTVLLLDRVTKTLALRNLISYDPYRVFSFFDLTLTYNTGAAFSFLNNASGWQNMVFINLAYVVCIMIVYWLYKLPEKERWMNVALSLIFGGAFGNAWDRILYGYVIDFIDLHIGEWHFAIFNIADAGICIGAFMMFLNWRHLPK